MAVSLVPNGIAANGYDVIHYDSATGQLEIFHNNVAVLQTVSGGVQSSTFTGSLNGNANTASQLQSARTITLTGAVSGSVSFDGSGTVSMATAFAGGGSGGIGTANLDDDAVSRAKLKDEVGLIIYNSDGVAVKTLYGAGS